MKQLFRNPFGSILRRAQDEFRPRSFRWSEANGEIGDKWRPLYSAPSEPPSRRTEEKYSVRKDLLLLSLISLALPFQPILIHAKTKPKQEEQNQTLQEEENDDFDNDIDAKVVLANVANMLGCIGIISTDPHNPAVLGPGLANIGVSFINIVTQIFKSHGFDDELTRARIETWFMSLSDETKKEIISLFITYANQVRALQYCPNCQCDQCELYRP
jgi:hypothetical protein